MCNGVCEGGGAYTQATQARMGDCMCVCMFKYSEGHSVVSDSLQPHRLYRVHGTLQARILEWAACPLSSTYAHTHTNIGLSWWLSGEESACRAGDGGFISGSGRCPGGGHGNPLQCSCLGNPMDRGAWRATVHGAAKSWT